MTSFNEQAAFLIEDAVALIKQVLIKHSAAMLEEMRDQIVARNTRIATLESEVAALKHDIERATQRNSDLLAEVEGMREDAERWRILRMQTGAHRTLYKMCMFRLPQWIDGATSVDLLKGSVAEHLDNAADAARKESNK